jgi:hypothetical protein
MKQVTLFFTFLSLLAISSIAQKSTFDIASYNAPADWKKADVGGVVVYTGIDNAKGRLCVLSIYKSTAGSGDAATDFTREWDSKVVKKFGCSSSPQIQNGEAKSGWQSKIGVDTFSQKGRKMMAILTTLTGEGKTICLLALTNDNSYINDLDVFYKSFEITATQVTNSNAGNQTTDTNIGAQPQSGTAGITYTLPADWKPKQTNNKIVAVSSPLLECTDQSYYTLFVLGTASYDGDLEEYAGNIYKAYFYQDDPVLKYKTEGRRIVKGIDEYGREFLSYENGSWGFASDNCWHYGLVYLIRTGNQVAAFMLELKPQNKDKNGPPSYFTTYFLYSCLPLNNTWKKFLSSVKFNNEANKKTYSADNLVGTWESRLVLGASIWGYVSSMPLQKYHFEEGGRWQSQKMATENNFGTYAVKDNKLVVTDGSGKTASYKFRVEKIFEYRVWNTYLILFDANGIESKLYIINE